MAKLSKLTSSKSRKSNNERSELIKRMSRRIPPKKDNSLLGDMFLTVEGNNLIEKTGNCEIVTNRTKLENNDIFFDGLSSSIDIRDNNIFNFGAEDFTVDWWEYKLPLPEPNYDRIDFDQCTFFKSSSKNKQPILVKNEKNKTLFISSDGEYWDISNGKYMGSIEVNKWSHWAITKSSNKFYTFKNGEVKNIWDCDKPIDSSKEFFTIGKGPKRNNYYGYIKNLRIVKNIALWSEEFSLCSEELFYKL